VIIVSVAGVNVTKSVICRFQFSVVSITHTSTSTRRASARYLSCQD
jgi:hypothetical protein